jgi:hypothetical protein
MGSLSTSWGALTPAERLTWFNNAGMVPLGFPLYVKRNQALFLAGLPGISSFVRGLPPLNLLQAANSPAGSPFFVGIDVNVPTCPGGFTQVNLWSKWVPPGRSFISRTRFMLTTDNFHWDTDASAYAFDPDAPDFPPASGWHMKVAYGAVQNSSGVLSLSNYLEFTNP